jgi:hypothetical protein
VSPSSIAAAPWCKPSLKSSATFGLRVESPKFVFNRIAFLSKVCPPIVLEKLLKVNFDFINCFWVLYFATSK